MGFQNVWIRFTLPINLKLCTESLPWSAQNLKIMRRLIKSYWERDFARYEFQHHAPWRDNIQQLSGPRLNIKKSSYQYSDSHHKIRRSQDRLFILEIPYLNRPPLYWDVALIRELGYTLTIWMAMHRLLVYSRLHKMSIHQLQLSAKWWTFQKLFIRLH